MESVRKEKVETKISKAETLRIFQDLIREPGWEVYAARIENIFQSAVSKMIGSNKDNVDYNRGYLDCAKLIKELRHRIIKENTE